MFILSAEEVEKLFPDKKQRIEIAHYYHDEELPRWWLRTMGRDGKHACIVSSRGLFGQLFGNIDHKGHPVDKIMEVRAVVRMFTDL